jgi:crotonobetainyl-CoA:carnitine CoA-transferase CaiB-like acyl-CoA transferase
MTAALDGFLVLDFTRVLSGPYCTMQLADMGARVVKIEQPKTGDDTRAWGPPFVNGESAYFLSINRNKESLTLDLKNPRAREVLAPLLAKADVLVENFRPGTMERLGLSYDSLSKPYPRLVYCSISGFGQSGPRRREAGYDAVVQAEGGLMSITGSAEGPAFRLGVAISDIVSGMFAAQGIAFALLARERTGRGQNVDVGMLDATAALLTYQAANYFATGKVPGRLGNRHPTIVPYETFEASDGEFVIAIGNDDQWRRLCTIMGSPELAGDERFATNRSRVANYETLRPMLATILGQRTRAKWVEELRGAGVPCGSVRDVGEVLADPHLDAREMIRTVEHAVAGAVRVTGVPIKLSDTPGSVRTPPPLLGQHTRDILTRDAGFTPAAVDELVASGVV